MRIRGFGDYLQISDDDAHFSISVDGITRKYSLEQSDILRTIDQSLYGKPVWALALSPDCAHLVAGVRDGVRLWDFKSGRTEGFVSLPGPRTVQVSKDGNWIFCSDANGIHRLALKDLIAATSDFNGAPKIESSTTAFALSADQLKIAFGKTDGHFYYGDVADSSPSPLGEQRKSPRYVAMSPDGKWAVSSSRFGTTFNVWDLSKRSLAIRVPTDSPGQELGEAGFTIDNAFLVTCDHTAIRWFEVGTWKLVRRIPRTGSINAGLLAFSPDGKLMAVSGADLEFTLRDPHTGEELVTLSSQLPAMANSLLFTPDSAQLIVAATPIQVWQLAHLRERLRLLGVDWSNN